MLTRIVMSVLLSSRSSLASAMLVRCILVGYMAELTTPHERALTLLFSELEGALAKNREVFLGTPGALTKRTNGNGTHFWVRRYSDAEGRRLETYVGTADDPDVVVKLKALRAQIEGVNAIISQVSLLARAGFVTVDRKGYAILASLHNRGQFDAGALLIGSHAYGALLNALGVKAVIHGTEAVDPIIAVPELKAHAKGLPYLGYLLGASQQVPILSPHGAVMVRVPVPERYAIHKLIVSQLQAKVSSKPEKDLQQAAVLLEVVTDRFPGAVEEALAAVPKSASRHIKLGIEALKRHLPESAAAAWDALS